MSRRLVARLRALLAPAPPPATASGPPPAPASAPPDRSSYKATWQALAATPETAAMAVAGYTAEEQLLESGRHTVEVLERLIGIGPSDVFLEIGCGVGRVGKLLSPRCRKWIGADISGHMLAAAAKRL